MSGNRARVRAPLRLLFRAPVLLYRCGLGWMLGRRLLMLSHTGRKSGRLRRTVLEVVRRDDAKGVCIVCSGFGPKAQWFRNILADPLVRVTTGARTWPGRAQALPTDAAEIEFRSYAARHPLLIRFIARMLLGTNFSGSDADFAALSQAMPVVELIRS